MPQDELWRASARSTGLRIEYRTPDRELAEHGVLVVEPTWSKQPTGRNGASMLAVPTYATWSVPEIISAVWTEWLGGDPKHVPAVASHAMRDVLLGYREGSRT